MVTALTILIAIISVLLMLVILIQNPKGGGVDSTLGGQGANQLFGASKSTNLVEKATWGLAIVLVILCILTTIVISNTTGQTGIQLLSE